MHTPDFRCVTSWLAAALACVVLPSVALQAQTADSTTFRAGQWGAEFAMGGFSSLGVLRFSTPRRAWIGAVTGRLENVERESDPSSPPFPPFGFAFERSGIDLSLGHRWYRDIAPRVQQHVTLGALISGARQNRVAPRQADVSENSVGGGAFADLGAIWMVTQKLSLGAAWNAQLVLGRTTTNGLPEQRQTTTSTTLSLGQVTIRGALYF